MGAEPDVAGYPPAYPLHWESAFYCTDGANSCVEFAWNSSKYLCSAGLDNMMVVGDNWIDDGFGDAAVGRGDVVSTQTRQWTSTWSLVSSRMYSTLLVSCCLTRRMSCRGLSHPLTGGDIIKMIIIVISVQTCIFLSYRGWRLSYVSVSVSLRAFVSKCWC